MRRRVVGLWKNTCDDINYSDVVLFFCETSRKILIPLSNLARGDLMHREALTSPDTPAEKCIASDIDRMRVNEGIHCSGGACTSRSRPRQAMVACLIRVFLQEQCPVGLKTRHSDP
jgi:hypothetical protein